MFDYTNLAMTTTTQPDVLPDPESRPAHWYDPRSKTALIISCGFCISLVWTLSRLIGVPAQPGFQGSLLNQTSPLLAVFLAAVTMVGCTLLMWVIQGYRAPEDAVLPAAAGMAALSFRGGSMVQLLQSAQSPSIYVSLCIEMLILTGLLVGCFYVLSRLSGNAHEFHKMDLGPQLQALGITTLIMGLLLMFLAQNGSKKQAVAAVLVSGFLAAALAEGLTVDAGWTYIRVLAAPAVGLIAYVWAVVSPAAWILGQPASALATALPLDYISAGVVGLLLGHWTAGKWRVEE